MLKGTYSHHNGCKEIEYFGHARMHGYNAFAPLNMAFLA